MKKVLLLSILMTGLVFFSVQGQINVKDKIKEKSTSRTDERLDEGVDKSLNKIEEGIGSLFKKKKKGEEVKLQENDETENDETQEQDPVSEQVQAQAQQKLQSFTQYDFVPGDKILYFEDFSQDAIGDFPALWTTNGSGEIKTVSIASGNWFHMNGQDAVYCFTKAIDFPANFIMEFDVIPDDEYGYGIQLSLYQDPELKELTDDLYPGEKGIHINVQSDMWETLGYDNITNGDWLTGRSETNMVIKEQVNHVIIWCQNRRLRIYHQGKKALDMPTNIYAGTSFNRFRFSGYDRRAYPYISNIKITTASPDTRSKLLTEGKLVSYGIYFDTGKDVVKPESYGSVKEIASILKENPSVRIKIEGHTDSDGDDIKNLDLSKRRAASVKNYLVSEFQIDASRIEPDGKGETKPIENNSTPEGKAKNRRVEFVKL